jgi:intein/homing endonuclease
MILEALDEAECYLIALLQDESGIDQAEFALQDSSAKKLVYDQETGDLLLNGPPVQQNDPPEGSPMTKDGDGCFRAYPFQYPWFRSSDQKQIDAAGRCLKMGQLILTSTGWVPIEEVEVGTLVLTHKNRWRSVTKVWDRGVKDVVKVQMQGHSDGLIMTPDHKLWARHANRGSVAKHGSRRKSLERESWIPADEFRFANGSQILDTHYSSPAEVEALPFVESMEPAYIPGRQNLVSDTKDLDWLWLYGLFVAEGNVYLDDVYARAEWNIHSNELLHVLAYFDRLGISYTHSLNSDDLGVKIRVNSRPVVKWLLEYSGRGAHNKFIAPWVYGLDRASRQAVLDGYIYGDGSQRKDKKTRNGFTTVSKSLVYSLRILANSLNMSFTVWDRSEHDTVIRGVQVHGSSGFSGELEPINVQKKPRAIIEHGHSWLPVDSIKDSGTAHVYDIEVEEDHSFVVEGVVVHNSVGKSLSIKLRAMAFPFLHADEEMVITAPGDNHLQLVTDNIDSLFQTCRLAKEMLRNSGVGNGAITHKPFKANFSNNSRIVGRIPHLDGKNIKGTHPLWLEMDEASDYPAAGWKEIVETVKIQNPDARWRAHGVTRGVGDDFDKKIKGEDKTWSIHRLPAMLRPNWTDHERIQKIEEYGGSVESIDYRRNVLGLPGDENSPMFVMHRIMQNVSPDPNSIYNKSEYYYADIDDAQAREVPDITDILDFPSLHTEYENFWIGMDVGWAQSPSAIVVFAETKKPRSNHTSLKLLTRILLRRISPEDQVKCILRFMEYYKPLAFAMDATGSGYPLLGFLQKEVRIRDDLNFMLKRIKDYNFSSKVIVGFNDEIPVNDFDPDSWEDAAVKRGVIEASTDAIRVLLDPGHLMLPMDQDLISELQAVPKNNSKIKVDEYGRSGHRKSGMHSLDAMRMACLAYSQNLIDQMIANHKQAWQPETMIVI